MEELKIQIDCEVNMKKNHKRWGPPVSDD